MVFYYHLVLVVVYYYLVLVTLQIEFTVDEGTQRSHNQYPIWLCRLSYHSPAVSICIAVAVIVLCCCNCWYVHICDRGAFLNYRSNEASESVTK